MGYGPFYLVTDSMTADRHLQEIELKSAHHSFNRITDFPSTLIILVGFFFLGEERGGTYRLSISLFAHAS